LAQSPLSQALLKALGGIETTRLIHHTAAVVMIIVSVYHLIAVLYRLIVLRVPWTMAPVLEDFKHLYEDVMYYFGLRKHKAYYGRYNYAEKVEYLAVVWGTIIMAITGFMMWNPIATTRFLPGQFIPAAKAAHGGEAVLAFNKSMFNGKMSEEEMKHEHPAELAQIKAGDAFQPPAPDVLQRRKKRFMPIAVVIALVGGFGLFFFVTLETTAIETVPPAETAQVYVPVTPSPRPTYAPTPTSAPIEGGAAATWDDYFSALFDNRCSTCHGITKVGGLSLATYESALAGGNSGPGIIPGNADQSMIVKMQSAGNHPGQLSQEELQQVIDWINAGAPEK
jgi:mono/diheme cytochrome c family protein